VFVATIRKDKILYSFCSFQCIFCRFLIYQVVQKQVLGEAENWTAIWWPVVSWMCVPNIIKIG